MTTDDEQREFVRKLWAQTADEPDDRATGIFKTRPATPTTEQEN